MVKERLKRSVRSLWWRNKLRGIPRRDDDDVLLHIGCGAIDSPGFINIDARKFPHVHVVTRVLTRFPLFPSGVADLVYMCHVLEHVPRAKVPVVLSEMHRLLKPGGTLRLSVPDFDRIVHLYGESGGDIHSVHGILMGGQDYRYNFHFVAFNAAYLGSLLEACGYHDVRTWDPRSCRHHDFEDWASRQFSYRGREYPISLNLEATK